MRWLAGFLLAFAVASAVAADSVTTLTSKLRDVATVEGVRDNPLIGYGIVVGLNGTGDRRQTLFTTQALASMLQRMGVQIPAGGVRVNNIASVIVTANLPPFARPGTQLDVTVSSIGDAKSLEGGLLLLTPLRAADGQVYAAAQGALTLGGYSAGGPGNSRQVNHPTVARIPSGALAERDASLNLSASDSVSLLLRDPDFTTANDIAAAINQHIGRNVAAAVDARRIKVAQTPGENVTALLARLEELQVSTHRRAKVVVNERTGTVVMGRDVRLGAVSILHGNLSIEITTEFVASQPQPMGTGDTVVLPKQNIRTQESPARRIELAEGASVQELVNGLQTIGATARDVVAILQAIKAAGGLQAELEVL